MTPGDCYDIPFVPDLPGKANLVARAYNTHYEIINYHLGDCPKIEADFSIWDPVTHRKIPYYNYDETNKILYVPRGYDVNIVASQTGKPITFIENHRPKEHYHFSVGNPPRDEYQKEMIRFLAGKGEYQNLIGASQQVLSLPTRSGKTYCTIAAISILESKAIIIVHSDTLREQWASEIVNHTQLGQSNICVISSSSFFDEMTTKRKRDLNDKYIFITTHRTIHNAIKTNGLPCIDETLSALNIGIKIIDEAHIEFRNTLITDYATNVWKTFYLTATFARSDSKENAIFQRAFNQVTKINKANPEREKTVKLFMVWFHTKPNYAEDQDICYQRRGFNRFRYIEYEMGKGVLDNVIKKILHAVIEEKRLDGKILILSSKVETCNHFKELVKSIYPEYSVCAHSSKDEVEDFREYGVICATPQKLGTGATIPKLRVVINTEPCSSAVNIIQIFGRLDVYEAGKDTYYFMIMDTGFAKIKKMFMKIKNTLKYYAKEIIELGFF